MKSVIEIYFWKRKVESIEQFDIFDSKRGKDGIKTTLDGKEFDFSSDEFKELSNYLLKDLDIENSNKEYQVYKYEDDKNDFSIKFFLLIEFNDCTYFAIKGTMPFKQRYYHEIVDKFTKIISK